MEKKKKIEMFGERKDSTFDLFPDKSDAGGFAIHHEDWRCDSRGLGFTALGVVRNKFRVPHVSTASIRY